MTPMRLSTREMIETLISFDTTSRNSNLELISFIEDYLLSHGVGPQRVMNEDGSKANLFATIGDASKPGGIVLSGHTDVVPVDDQDWSSDPFSVIEKDGKLFGRGTSDMKSFIAIALVMVPEFLKRGPATPVHLAFSYDEEVGCLGVRPMIDSIVRELPRPAVAIVGEPSMMKVVNAHKSIQSYFTTVTGLESHSSATDKGVSAVFCAMELIGFLGGLAQEMRERSPEGCRFSPPYTTINVGMVKGGTAVNIIPRKCQFGWEYRALPDDDPDEIINRFTAFAEDEVLPRMRKVYPEARIETRVRAKAPGLVPENGSPAETLILKLAQCNETEAVSYATEAGLFQMADVPTLVCGPGDIAQAHKPDEFIELSQIAECERFMMRLAEHVAG